MPSQDDLLKSVSKKLKYYFDVKRREDGFDLSGPYTPRPDHPPLKSRPTLMYDGLHDKPVKHYFSRPEVRQRITHMRPPQPATDKEHRIKRQLRRYMAKYSFVSKAILTDEQTNKKAPWVGVGRPEAKGTSNTSKYVSDPFQMLRETAAEVPKFTKPFRGGRPLLRSVPPDTISRGEAVRLVNSASRLLLASQIVTELDPSPETSQRWPFSSKGNNHGEGLPSVSVTRRHGGGDAVRCTQSSGYDTDESDTATMGRHLPRPSTALAGERPGIHRAGSSPRPATAVTYHDTKEKILKELQENEVKENFEKGRVTYNIDGKKVPLPPRKKYFEDFFLPSQRPGSAHALLQPSSREVASVGVNNNEEKVPAWLRRQMRMQVVDERKLYNDSVRPAEDAPHSPVPPPRPASSDTGASSRPTSTRPVRARQISSSEQQASLSGTADGEQEDDKSGSSNARDGFPQRGQRRPKSARHSARLFRSDDRDLELARSSVTLSEDGSYEEVRLDESEAEDDVESQESTRGLEEKGVQTGWDLFAKFDQTQSIVDEGETASYKVIVRTGKIIGASCNVPVRLALFGDRGRSQDVPLENSETHKVAFQKGNEDVFKLLTVYVGELQKIQIGHDKTDAGQSWFLDSVAIEDLKKGWVYEFPCNKWLSIRCEDKMTRRDLVYSSTRLIDHTEKPPSATWDNKVAESKSKGELETHERSDTSADGGTADLMAASDGVARSKVHSGDSMEALASLDEVKRQPMPSHYSSSVSDLSEQATPRNVPVPSSLNVIHVADLAGSVTEELRAGTLRKGGADDFFDVVDSTLNDARVRMASVTTKDDDDFDSNAPLSSHGRNVADNNEDDEEAKSVARSEGRSTVVFDSASVTSRELLENNEFMTGFKVGMDAARKSLTAEQRAAVHSRPTAVTPLPDGPSIHAAARSGNIARMKELVAHSDYLKNNLNETRSSPLHVACQHGHVDAVRYLIGAGADAKLKNSAGYEAVHEAAMHGHVSCIMVLVAMGMASIDVLTDDKKTPLHLAAMSGHLEACQWLIGNRASVDEQDDFGRTATDLAGEYNHEEVRDFLEACQQAMSAVPASDGQKPAKGIVMLRGFNEGTGAKKLHAANTSEVENALHQDAEAADKDDEELSDGGSAVDLRHKVENERIVEDKRKLYEKLEERKQSSGLSFLDMVRLDAEKDSDDDEGGRGLFD